MEEKVITYTVYFKRHGDLFWNRIKNVCQDGFFVGSNLRWFQNDKDEVIEMSPIGMIFRFSKERLEVIIKNNSNEEKK